MHYVNLHDIYPNLDILGISNLEYILQLRYSGYIRFRIPQRLLAQLPMLAQLGDGKLCISLTTYQ